MPFRYSNRQSYEKLELDVTFLESMKVPFLIDSKTHFVQGYSVNLNVPKTEPKSPPRRCTGCNKRFNLLVAKRAERRNKECSV